MQKSFENLKNVRDAEKFTEGSSEGLNGGNFGSCAAAPRCARAAAAAAGAAAASALSGRGRHRGCGRRRKKVCLSSQYGPKQNRKHHILGSAIALVGVCLMLYWPRGGAADGHQSSNETNQTASTIGLIVCR